MSTNNRQTVDVRALATTGLTSSTTLATHLQGLETAIKAVRVAGNAPRVEKVLELLNDAADLMRELHL